MKFDDYCAKNRGIETKLAKVTGKTLSHVSTIKRKKRKCLWPMAVAITLISDGQVPLSEHIKTQEIDQIKQALRLSGETL